MTKLWRAAGRGLLACALIAPAACDSGRPAPDALLRVDQVGYATGETKIAMLLAPRVVTGTRATVLDDDGGAVVATASVGADRGAWNSRFPHVYPVDLSAVTRPGTYRIRVAGPVTAQSPPFRVASGADLFAPLAGAAVTYFQNHRDGADQLPGPWQRAPAHLADRAATVYRPPGYAGDGRMTEGMTPAGGPVDVEGGWYDAGDYLKFTHTTAYALIVMLLVRRDTTAAPAGLAAETRHGLAWLDKMWDGDTATLYTQVGIGSGLDAADGGFLGDHDAWRLPQADDRLAVVPGDARYYQRYRPVFRAAEPGDPLSPNLAGRVSAAFALAAQVAAPDDPDLARRYLSTAAQVFALADTAPDELVTTQPRAFYPEDSWADDLATGATELALAAALLRDPGAEEWARQATHWAAVNAATGRTAALSLYDLSAVADADLGRLLASTPVAEAEISVDELRGDLRRRLDAGVAAAAADPLGAAAGSGGADYASRQFGYAAGAALYERMSGDHRYAAFGTAQRGIALGVNGWGTSLVIGAGSTYPRCPHDQIASLTRPGRAVVMAGAVVNGPNTAARVDELRPRAEPNPCAAEDFGTYDRDDAHYLDNVRVSANSEPSIDFTATGMLAFALAAGRR